ncbi:hypothetical protein FB45DRAFT_1077911, partial [Roridomyces roridus]
QHFGLHRAALVGDDEGVRRALHAGATVNDLDATGRTAVMCAVAGEQCPLVYCLISPSWDCVDASNAPFPTSRVQVLRTLLSDKQLALFTLNAPQMAYRGVTPLGMAAWLNAADMVRALLEETAIAVVVDGPDVHGATPLMYAARDGRLDVVQLLLRHGACPDANDGNYRTAVQFALAYPQILWLCETALRRHRWLESQSTDRSRISSNSDADHLLHIAHDALSTSCTFEAPPLAVFSAKSTSTKTIIESVKNADVAFLHSLLFAPSIPASSQSSLYPLSSPALVNLPDARGWSAIHHCAAAEYPSVQILDALYCAGAVPLFTTHEHWTPLHCFVQTSRRPGPSRPAELLYQFLAHLVHDLRVPLAATDKDDETCIHIAAEKGTCIEVLILLLDCDTSGSVREMRNSRGLTALEVCQPEFRAAFGEQLDDLRSASSLSCYTIRPAASESQASLSLASEDAAFDHEEAASLLNNVDISASSEQLLANLRLTAPAESQSAKPFHLNVLDNLLREAANISTIVSTHYRTIADEAVKDVTSLRAGVDKVQGALDRACRDVEHSMRARGIAPSTALLRKRFNRESEDSQATAVSVDLQAARSCERVDKLQSENKTVEPVGSPAKNSKQSGTTKLKAWMLRKLMPGETVVEPSPPRRSTKVSLKAQQRPTLDVIPEQQTEIQKPIPSPSPAADPDLSADAWTDGLLRASYVALQAANRDLDRIRDCIISAEHFISVVDRCAARTERVVSRALTKRQTAITQLRASIGDDDDFFVRPAVISAKSSIMSLSSLYSARSSCVSLAATLVEQEDDDDTRLVRRLLLRKIDAGASGVQEQLERGVNWLCAVREVIRGAKRTAYI